MLKLSFTQNEQVSEGEARYLENRHKVIAKNFNRFYEDLSIPGIDIEKIKYPTISVAISGGGFRSMLISSGFILGMHQHGLWECTSYVTGISGGSWTLLKLILADFDLSSLTKFDIERVMLEGIPNFDLKNHDMIRQGDSGNDNQNNAKLLAMDAEFVRELRQQSIPLNKRDYNDEYTEQGEGYVPDYYQFLDELKKIFDTTDQYPENLLKFDKRSMDALYKIKGLVEDFFHQDETDQDSELDMLNDLMESFGKFRKTIGFYINLHREVRQKKEAGFPISFTDYLGQALIDRVPVGKLSSAKQFSNFLQSKKVAGYEVPIPIIVANAKTSKRPDIRNVVFEFSPFEFGSWHQNVSKFINMEYLGSSVEKGKLENCVKGFDSLGFITATSSSLFNNALLYIWKMVTTNIESNDKLKAIKTLFGVFGIGLSQLRSDYAIYQPNPYYGDTDVLSSISGSSRLLLVDGGEDGENIPIRPLLVSGRENDVIFIVDSSSDKENLPQMRKLQDTYDNIVMVEKNRRLVAVDEEIYEMDPMPYIPTQKELLQSNYSLSAPIAFGCHLQSYSPIRNNKKAVASQKKSLNSDTQVFHMPPILIYHGNYPITFQSNTSTFKLNYTKEEYNGMLNNGHHLFNNGDPQDEYLQCLGCVMLLRNNANQTSSFCDECVAKIYYN